MKLDDVVRIAFVNYFLAFFEVARVDVHSESLDLWFGFDAFRFASTGRRRPFTGSD
jgi:hypothetical protein